MSYGDDKFKDPGVKRDRLVYARYRDMPDATMKGSYFRLTNVLGDNNSIEKALKVAIGPKVEIVLWQPHEDP